ncbi:MAG: ACP S-malonyltransferase [Deltaproteobacteria bacterium]|nr:ACP S-malonyltransferase [Deltaproteobacteria bacterium]
MYSIVFPGQGSQSVGMSVDFCDRYPAARDVFAEADDAFGGGLAKRIREGPEEELRRTEVTQPAILTASIAVYRALEAELPQPPVVFAGHSLGEYTALVAAGALGLADAVRLVRRRGAFMQDAVPEGEGAMAAILGLDPESVARVCAGIDAPVAPANFNTPVQTVIAGRAAAVAEAGEALSAAGARRVVALEVSAPFHCELMSPAADKLAPVLSDAAFGEARIPVISNVTAEPYRSAADARRLLREQVCAPVRWVDGVRRQQQEGVKLQLELGPGKVLTGMAARIERSLGRANVERVDDVDKALRAVAEACA